MANIKLKNSNGVDATYNGIVALKVPSADSDDMITFTEGGSGIAWGGISGTLDNQTDLKNKFSEKASITDLQTGEVIPYMATKAVQIQTEDSVVVKDEAIISTTGGMHSINSTTTGFTAYLDNIKGASAIDGEFSFPTASCSDDIGMQVDTEQLTVAYATGILTENTYTTAEIAAKSNTGITFTKTYTGTETIDFTLPSFQTISFPTIVSFNSTAYNLMNSNKVAKVIQGNRYLVNASCTVAIDGVSQTIEANYISSRGYTVPYSFVASKTGEATFSAGTICALVWSGKYYNRTTDVTYSVSTISLNKTLKAIGNVKDVLTATSFTHNIAELALSAANLRKTADKVRVITTSMIYYVDDKPVIDTLSLSFSFTANDFGEVYFILTGAQLALEFTCVYGENLVDKITNDLLVRPTITTYTSTSQTLSSIASNSIHVFSNAITYLNVSSLQTIKEGESVEIRFKTGASISVTIPSAYKFAVAKPEFQPYTTYVLTFIPGSICLWVEV